MEDDLQEHPASSLSRKFLVDQISISNQLVSELLLRIQNALVDAIPNEKSKIEQTIESFKHSFNSCSSLISRGSSTFIKLPVSVQMREDGQERKEGTYAVTITENIGIRVLEECCRKIVFIPDDVEMVEARKYEPELNCFCTIPKLLHQNELIEGGGVKYELVFEKRQPPHVKIPNAVRRISSHKQVYKNYNTDFQNEASNSNELSPVPELQDTFEDEGALLRKLFSRNRSGDFNSPLPGSDLTINSSSSSRTDKDKGINSARLLPEFDPLEIFTECPRGLSVFEYLKRHKMDKNGKVRITFVQILGKYYLEVIKPKLDGPSTAFLRRAFIDKVFSSLKKVLNKPLPPQELFSNKRGKGFFDIYLKHQTTKDRRLQPPSRSTAGVEEFAYNLVDQHCGRNSTEPSSNSPDDQISLKSEHLCFD